MKQYKDPTDPDTLKSINALCVRLVFCLYAEDAGIFGSHGMFHDYPIWYTDMPMIVYNFLESYDFSGKTVIPFNTHEGSGQSGTQSRIETAIPTATVLNGLAIRGATAQNDTASAKSTVERWITEDLKDVLP